MRLRLLIPLAAILIAAGVVSNESSRATTTARAQLDGNAIDPTHVVVTYRSRTTQAARRVVVAAAAARGAEAQDASTDVLTVAPGRTVGATIAALRRRPEVASAVPDYRLHAADFIPNDPGRGGYAGWQALQWNFTGPWSVNAPAAWDDARKTGAPGGRGVVVAVIDSGVAFENRGRFRRAPDLYSGGFVAPYDFINHNHHPDDEESHGTHVTSTIAEKTNNNFGVTGLSYDVRIMPLRVLDAEGNGDGSSIADAIRYAVRHHARVINMSVEFDTSLHAADIPEVITAIDYAYSRGVVMVGASGNEGESRIAYPARDPKVISVGATTADGCLADYSNWSSGLTLVAPGGGQDAALSGDPSDDANCHPTRPGRDIYQETFSSDPRHFGLLGFEGTSFATPHVSAAAALLIATHRLGANPSPDAVKARLEQTARDLGPAGYDDHYGAGLVDIAAALAP